MTQVGASAKGRTPFLTAQKILEGNSLAVGQVDLSLAKVGPVVHDMVQKRCEIVLDLFGERVGLSEFLDVKSKILGARRLVDGQPLEEREPTFPIGFVKGQFWGYGLVAEDILDGLIVGDIKLITGVEFVIAAKDQLCGLQDSQEFVTLVTGFGEGGFQVIADPSERDYLLRRGERGVIRQQNVFDDRSGGQRFDIESGEEVFPKPGAQELNRKRDGGRPYVGGDEASVVLDGDQLIVLTGEEWKRSNRVGAVVLGRLKGFQRVLTGEKLEDRVANGCEILRQFRRPSGEGNVQSVSEVAWGDGPNQIETLGEGFDRFQQLSAATDQLDIEGLECLVKIMTQATGDKKRSVWDTARPKPLMLVWNHAGPHKKGA